MSLLYLYINCVNLISGNHELWIRPKDEEHIGEVDSVDKLQVILGRCRHLGIHVDPAKFSITPQQHVWIVPLLSWYAGPEEDPDDSIYIKGTKVPEDRGKDIYWMDNSLCKWPDLDGKTKSKYFASLNEKVFSCEYDGPVISFSHMVPKRELILPNQEDIDASNKDRRNKGLGPLPEYKNPLPGFNFTRYAGANIISAQAERLGAQVHVYGHQHRNRDRTIGGIRYVSHCLGNPREQRECFTYGFSQWKGPKQVWPPLYENSVHL